MRLVLNNIIEIQDPTNDLRKWVEKECKIYNPEYEKKVRMGFWIGNTPEYLYMYEVREDKLILPIGTIDLIPFELIMDAQLIDERKHGDKVFKSLQTDHFNLYDYQKEAVSRMCKDTIGILQAPAGSGKTQMALAIIGLSGLKTLWITHTIDLLKQSKGRAERFFDKDMLGEITAGKVNIQKITFATIQTLCKLDLSKYENEWDMVIVDECHRVAGSPTTVTRYYHVLNSLRSKYKYGLSATVHRSDGLIKTTLMMLGAVKHIVPDEAVESKIMRVDIDVVETGTKVSLDMLNTDGTFNFTKLITALCEDMDRNRLIVTEAVKDKDKSILVLSDRVSHLETLQALLPLELKNKSYLIHGNLNTKQGKAFRERAIEDMRSGKATILFATYSLAKEGLDIPRLERVYLTTPHKDYAVITQSIGRVARIFEGKTEAVCKDFVDDIPYCVKAYKKRVTIYRKAKCQWL